MPTSRFPSNLSSAEGARRFVAEELGRAALSEEALFRVQLLTTELVTNAVRHARSPVDLTVEQRRDRIRVEVSDGSPVRPSPVPVSSPTRHRGLLLVEDLSENWGVDVQDHNGKTVWFEVPAA